MGPNGETGAVPRIFVTSRPAVRSWSMNAWLFRPSEKIQGLFHAGWLESPFCQFDITVIPSPGNPTK